MFSGARLQGAPLYQLAVAWESSYHRFTWRFTAGDMPCGRDAPESLTVLVRGEIGGISPLVSSCPHSGQRRSSAGDSPFAWVVPTPAPLKLSLQCLEVQGHVVPRERPKSTQQWRRGAYLNERHRVYILLRWYGQRNRRH